MKTPLLDLLHRGGLGQVRSDPPVLLRRIDQLIVDPAAVGGLEQGVVEEEQEPPARAEDPGHLGDGVIDVVDVLEDEAGNGAVEGGRGEGQPGRRRSEVGRLVTSRHPAPDRLLDLGSDGVDSGDQGPGLGQGPRCLALAGPNVEHPPVTGQPVDDQGQDLVGVLRIDPIGELPLPTTTS